MKTKLFNLIYLSFFSILLLGCCDDCNYISVSLHEVNIEDAQYEICTSKESVFVKQSKYDTHLGEATLLIPVPLNHSLKKIKQEGNEIWFETYGKDFTNDYNTYKVDVDGFDKKPQSVITVYLDIKITGDDLCGPGTLGEKKKKSEVTGVPFDGNK